jgi:pimeloyl-ACP methyl ester carboxylesterase
MNYIQIGTGSDLILALHGFMSDHEVFIPLINEVEKKQPNRYTWLLPDLDGYGSSRDFLGYKSLNDLAKDILEIIENIRINKIHFIGHSMGGYIGLEMINLNPEVFQSFLLLNSHPFTDSEERATNRQKSVQFIERHGTSYYIKETFKSLFSVEFASRHQEIVENLKKKAENLSKLSIVNSLNAMIGRNNHFDTLMNTKVKKMIFLGSNDKLIPIEDYRHLIDIFEKQNCHIAQNAGHMCMFEATENLADFILKKLIK